MTGRNSTTAKTLLNLAGVFGAPTGMKAVLIYLSVADSGAAATDTYIVLGPNSTAGAGIAFSPMSVNSRYNRGSFIVPCDADGNFYYQISASGANTFYVAMQIWGYVV